MNLQAREKLRDLILDLRDGKSRRAFARELNVTATAVIGWENCTSEPDRENLAAIALRAGYTLEELVNHLEGKPPTTPLKVDRVKREIDALKTSELAEIYRFVSDKVVAIAESAPSV